MPPFLQRLFSVRIRCRVVLRHLQLVCVEFNDLAAGAFSLALEVCNKLAHTGPIGRSSDDVGRSSRSHMAMLLHVPKMGTPCPLFEKRGLRRTVSINKVVVHGYRVRRQKIEAYRIEGMRMRIFFGIREA